MAKNGYVQDDMDDMMDRMLTGGKSVQKKSTRSHQSSGNNQDDFLNDAIHAKVNFSELNSSSNNDQQQQSYLPSWNAPYQQATTSRAPLANDLIGMDGVDTPGNEAIISGTASSDVQNVINSNEGEDHSQDNVNIPKYNGDLQINEAVSGSSFKLPRLEGFDDVETPSHAQRN